MPPDKPAAFASLRLVFGSVFTLNWMGGLFLAGCVFLPLAEGCNGDPIYPTALIMDPVADPVESWLERAAGIVYAFWMARPYLYGIALCLFTVTAILVPGPTGLRLLAKLWAGWSALALAMLVALLVGSIVGEDADWSKLKWEQIGVGAAIGVPPLCVVLLQFRFWRRGHTWAAITTAHIGWALMAALRFGFWIDPRAALIGGKLSLALCLWLMECGRLQHRFGRDLFSHRADTTPRLRFTTRYIMAVTFAVAAFVTWCLVPEAPA